MELPIVAPAPVVTDHAGVFRDLFDNQCQFRHFQHYLTGLIVLPNKSMANIARCILDSADKTNLSRFLSEAPWREDAINRRRIRFMLQQTKPHRRRRRDSLVVIDDTLCEHVGSLFDYVDRHYNHSDGTYPLAHNPVTSFYVSGPVRFPLGLRLYRRYEELTQWEAAVAKHFPISRSRRDKKARNRLHKQVDPVLLQDPEFRARHEQFRTKIALAIDLVEEAIRRKVPFGVVVFDAWYLAEDLVRVLARRRKDWISLLKTNRLLETASFQLRDANGWAAEAAQPPHRGRGARAADPGPGLSPRQSRRAYLLVLHAGGPHPWPGQGADRGELRARVVDRAPCRAGDEPGGLERRQDHRPVPATVADGDSLNANDKTGWFLPWGPWGPRSESPPGHG